MKRLNLMIVVILTLSLSACLAMAKPVPLPGERAPSNEAQPGFKYGTPATTEVPGQALSTIPPSKGGSFMPNEFFIPSLSPNPWHFMPNIPNEEAPPLGEIAPRMLRPAPTAPQFSPTIPPRGVSPVPPPSSPGGPQWNDGKKPWKWMRMFKLWEPGS